MKQPPQHLIDLMPEALRLRANARATRGRNIMYSMVGILVLTLATVHSYLLEARASLHLNTLRTQASQLEQNERQISNMQEQINRLQRNVERYRRVELPLKISRIIAAVVDSMPEATAFDRLEIHAEQLRRSGMNSWRSRRVDGDRALTAEIAGFARSDLEIADFVGNLDRLGPFDDVSLDFSRQRVVRDVPAREFRLSFFVDLNRTYVVAAPEELGRSDSPPASRDGIAEVRADEN